MGTIDLRKLDGDQVVIHFGGALTSVDAYTFANSLISLADAARSIVKAIDQDAALEVRLEAVGPGSFKAVLRKIRKRFGPFIFGAVPP